MKILIADSGSTKTDWALVDEQGNVMVTCKTQGISPIHQSDAEILDVLCKELVPVRAASGGFLLWQWSNRGDEVSHEITLAAVFSRSQG